MRKHILTGTFAAMLYASRVQIYWCGLKEPGFEAARTRLSGESDVIPQVHGNSLNSDVVPSPSREPFMDFRDPFILPEYEDHSVTGGPSEKDYALEVIASNYLSIKDSTDPTIPEDGKFQEILEELRINSAWAEHLVTRKPPKGILRPQNIETAAKPRVKTNAKLLRNSQVQGIWAKLFSKRKHSEIKEKSMEMQEQKSEVKERIDELKQYITEDTALIQEVFALRRLALFQNLERCLNSIFFEDNEEIRYPLPWLVRYEKALFQVINYLCQFQVITPEQLNQSFANKDICKRAGEHIARLFSHGIDVHFGAREYFRPDLNYLTMTWQTKHLHHYLGFLEHSKQKQIIHIAFGKSYRISKGSDWWKYISPDSKKIAEQITKNDFFEEVEKWEKKKATSDEISTFDEEPNLERNMHYLMVNIMWAVKTHKIIPYASNKREYMFQLLMFNYLVTNLCEKEFFVKYFQNEGLYIQFYDRLQLISVTHLLLSWLERLRGLETEAAYERIENLSEIDEGKMIGYVKNLTNIYHKHKFKYQKSFSSPDSFLESIYDKVSTKKPIEETESNEVEGINLEEEAKLLAKIETEKIQTK